MNAEQEFLQMEAMLDMVISKANRLKKYCHLSRAKVNGGVSTSAATSSKLDAKTIADAIAKRESRRKFKSV